MAATILILEEVEPVTATNIQHCDFCGESVINDMEEWRLFYRIMNDAMVVCGNCIPDVED